MGTNRIIPYRKDLKVKARVLRKNSTYSEVLLWQEIKNNALGYRFRRQVPMLDYIVDFYCHELQIAIEIDGASHGNEQAEKYDNERQKRLEEWGVTFLRFDDRDIKTHMPFILEEIMHLINNIQNR